MTEDEFVEYIFSNLRAKGIEPLDWYEEILRMIWRGYDVTLRGGRRCGKMVLLREVNAARDLIEKHRAEYFPGKKED